MQLQGSVALLFCALAISALLGCGRTEGGPDSVPARSEDSAGTAEPRGAAGDESDAAHAQDISLEIAGREDYDALIAAHAGKVVVVDFWATWCGPCVEQFPHTVQLSRKFDPAEVAVVSVSMDEPSDQESVQAFLQDAGAEFENLISKYGVGQEGFEAFEITDGAIPHYKVYDQAGELRRAASSNEGLEELIQQLLDEE
jgi:thiol-disulfide isomerase/thioredoxin